MELGSADTGPPVVIHPLCERHQEATTEMAPGQGPQAQSHTCAVPEGFITVPGLKTHPGTTAFKTPVWGLLQEMVSAVFCSDEWMGAWT
jgi:hypothetical protein